MDDELRYAIEVAREAGKIALEHFGRVERLTKTHSAAHAEAVTMADRACQRYIVEQLRRRFPGDGMIGEENDTGTAITFDCPDPNGRVWVIDPIDGTNNFIAGFPAFAVCIGLLERGYPVLGVILDVCRNQVYSAAKGSGAFVDGRPIAVLDTPMDESTILMLTSNLLNKDGKLSGWAQRLTSQVTWKVRIIGSAALEAGQVAAGIAHAAITVHGKLWDAAAGAAIVLEAGGVFTDLAGKAIFPFDLRQYAGAKVPFVAAGPAAHGDIVREITSGP